MNTEKNIQDQLVDVTTLSRQQLAARWSCSVETIKRKEKAGFIVPLRLGRRLLRFRLSDILQIEQESLAE